jgi:hypothetical protein
MAITNLTAIQNESSDCTTAELADLTTSYGQGGNPARSGLALYVYLFKRDSALSDTAVTIDNTDPLNVSRWSFSLVSGVDGWYVAFIFNFRIWAAGTYTLNNCVYHSGSYYKCNAASTTGTPGVSADWTLITNVMTQVYGVSNTNADVNVTNNFTTCNADSGVIADNLAEFGEKVKSGKCKNWADAAQVLFGAALIESAVINHRRADNQEAQEIIDYVNTQLS